MVDNGCEARRHGSRPTCARFALAAAGAVSMNSLPSYECEADRTPPSPHLLWSFGRRPNLVPAFFAASRPSFALLTMRSLSSSASADQEGEEALANLG
jgi:hypothetical protein